MNGFVSYSFYNKKKDIKTQLLTKQAHAYFKNQTIKSFKSNKFSYLFYRNINHNINCALL